MVLISQAYQKKVKEIFSDIQEVGYKFKFLKPTYDEIRDVKNRTHFEQFAVYSSPKSNSEIYAVYKSRKSESLYIAICLMNEDYMLAEAIEKIANKLIDFKPKKYYNK